MLAGNGVAAPGEPAAAADAAGSGWNPFDLLHGYVKRGVDYVYDDIVAAIVWCAVLTSPRWRRRHSTIHDSFHPTEQGPSEWRRQNHGPSITSCSA